MTRRLTCATGASRALTSAAAVVLVVLRILARSARPPMFGA